MLMIQILVAFAVGLFLGILQSFVVGILCGSWAGGTGLAWGFIVAIPAAISAVWLGWYGAMVAAGLAILILGLTLAAIRRDQEQR